MSSHKIGQSCNLLVSIVLPCFFLLIYLNIRITLSKSNLFIVNKFTIGVCLLYFLPCFNDVFTLDWQLCQVVWKMENFTLASVYLNKKNRGTAGDVNIFLRHLGLTADKS